MNKISAILDATWPPDGAIDEQARVLSIVYGGGAEGTRTPDLLRAKEALSQLSYSPKMGDRGLEPLAFCV